jgi:hypothetical protein
MAIAMDGPGGLVLVILLGGVILLIAFKTGSIGGGGAGASRDENPILFWMGFTITATFTAIAIFILIWTLLGLSPPLSGR